MFFFWGGGGGGGGRKTHATLFLSPNEKITTYAFSQSQLHLNKISITHKHIK